jgi:hypothetical protein
MTPKEKAEGLVKKMYVVHSNSASDITLMFAKQCALIAVDEILKSEPRCPSDVDWDDVGGNHKYYYEAEREDANKYWQEVKQEIEKL